MTILPRRRFFAWTWPRLRGQFSRFAATTGGNILIMFGLAAPIFIGVAGFGIDYGLTISAKTKADAAADAAVIAGIQRASKLYDAGDTAWKTKAEAETVSFFYANSKLPMTTLTSVTASITRANGKFDATVNYAFTRNTTLTAVLGPKVLNVKGASTAAANSTPFIVIHFLIDNSGSMGIGAEQADQIKMYNNNGCAFACHTPTAAAENIYGPAAAKKIGAKLRIDVAREAILQAIADIRAQGLPADQVRISLRTFSNVTQLLQGQTSDWTNLIAATEKIQLANDVGVPVAGTYIKAAFTDLAVALPPTGAGTSATDRKSYVVLFTDGIEDSVAFRRDTEPYFRHLRNPGIWPQPFTFQTGWDFANPDWATFWDLSRMQPFATNSCKALKDKNHTVMPLRIKYVPPYKGDNEDKIFFITSTIAKKIEKSFEECASDVSTLVTASNSAEIQPALRKIIDNIARKSGIRLTK